MKTNQTIIAGRRVGVQSCNAESANVFVEIEGLACYVRIDLVEKKVEPSSRNREAVQFVEKNFSQFDQFCSTLYHTTEGIRTC